MNALVPNEGYTVQADLHYGQEPRHRLDLYVPDTPDKTLPVVVFLYGGNWQSGSKEDYLFVGEAFASRGFVTAIPDYRLYPDVRFPAFIEDAAAALTWLRKQSGAPNTREKPVYLVGHSAGAYIASMLSLDNQWLARAGDTTCDAVAATVGLAGPYDFLPLKSDTLKRIFGPVDERARTQPINHVNGAAPPMLLVTGQDDTTVMPRNSVNLAARIRENGGTAKAFYYEDIGHVGLVASLAKPFQGTAPTLDDIDLFLRSHRTARGCPTSPG